jgi:predicted branched-subunit amino acid permease
MAAGGIPPLEGMAMSVLVYAGAAMLAATKLIVEGVLNEPHGALVVVAAAFIVNLRLLMYSASIRQHFADQPLSRRLMVSYALVDNPYALFIQRFGPHPEAGGKFDYFVGLSIPIWLCWQATVGAGLLVGNQMPAAWKLDFAAPLAFIAMSIPLLRDKPMVAAAVSAGITAVLAHGLPLRSGMALAAAVGIVAGLLAERIWRVKTA